MRVCGAHRRRAGLSHENSKVDLHVIFEYRIYGSETFFSHARIAQPSHAAYRICARARRRGKNQREMFAVLRVYSWDCALVVALLGDRRNGPRITRVNDDFICAREAVAISVCSIWRKIWGFVSLAFAIVRDGNENGEAVGYFAYYVVEILISICGCDWICSLLDISY